MAQEDELLPGLFYVALAGLSGSLVARQRNILIRMFSPLAFATAAGAYFLPHTTHSIIDSIGGPMTSTYPTRPSGFGHHGPMSRASYLSTPSSSSSQDNSPELASRTREAWHGESRAGQASDAVRQDAHRAQQWVDGKVHEAGDSIDDIRGEASRLQKSASGWFQLHKDEVEDEVEGKVKEVKDRWSTTSSKVEDAAEKAKDNAVHVAEQTKDKAQGASAWFSTKAHEAEKVVENSAHKAKDWVDDTTAVVEQKLEASAKDADEWWKAQAAKEEKRAAEKKHNERKMAERAWFHRQRTDEKHPEHPEHSKWWSGRYNPAGAVVGAGVGLDAADHHPPIHHHRPRGEFPSDPSLKHHYNHPHHNSFLGYASDFGSDGALDDEDVENPDRLTTIKSKIRREFPSDPSLKHHYNHPHHNSFLGYASDFGSDGMLDDEDVENPDRLTTAKSKIRREFPSDPSLKHHYNHPHHNSFLGYASDFGSDGMLDDEDVENPDRLTTIKSKIRREFPSDPSLKHHYNHPHHNSFLGYASDFGSDGALDDEDVKEADRPTTGTRRLRREFPSDPSLVHHYNHPHRNSFLGIASDFGSDGALDDEDVNEWSSTKRAIGTYDRHLSDHHHPHHRHHFWTSRHDGYHHSHEPEYWSNGEEISTASVRDAAYYNYPGSFRDSSLSRSSWWSRTSRDHEIHMAELRERANALAWETKQAEERAAFDLADKLAVEQVALELSAAEAKKRAEAAARHAKEQSEALIRERQLAVERATKDMELRLAAEKESAERAAADAKAKAHAWELEQRRLAEQAAQEVRDRVLREKLAAEDLKDKADAWAHEQKEKAELAAHEIRERVLRETAAAEKSAQDAKAHLEAKARAEKDKFERNAHELEEKVRQERIREEQAAMELRERAEALVREQKLKVEKTARELEERLSIERAENKTAFERAFKDSEQLRAFERAEADALAAKARAESLLSEARRSAPLSTRSLKEELESTSSGWSWPWSSKSPTIETTTRVKHHDHEGFDSSGQLMEHIAEDIRQTKDDIQGGFGHLKDTVLTAESKAAEAVNDALYGADKHATEAVNEAKPKVEKAASEGDGWWSARTKDVERKLGEVDSEVRTGLHKAGDKLREMDRESSSSDDDFWFKNEQSRQQQQRRESGRAM
ncbi:hypothetical protein MVEG_01651 [Podila verticillata NRRL 6337]|nr:hypothetical protein MVEG_01651 [Podila verticillata NRRL 6337]